jgi:predicted nuclease with TOPRIM domain
MNLKQKIWDFFKQKEDIVDHELNRKIATSISDLNRRAHNLEVAVSDLKKKQVENTNDISRLTLDFKGLKDYVSNMDKVYSHKISKITNN